MAPISTGKLLSSLPLKSRSFPVSKDPLAAVLDSNNVLKKTRSECELPTNKELKENHRTTWNNMNMTHHIPQSTSPRFLSLTPRIDLSDNRIGSRLRVTIPSCESFKGLCRINGMSYAVLPAMQLACSFRGAQQLASGVSRQENSNQTWNI